MSQRGIPREGLVILAMCRLGGTAHLSALYEEVKRLFDEFGIAQTRTLDATIRRTVQDSVMVEPVDDSQSGNWTLTTPVPVSDDTHDA